MPTTGEIHPKSKYVLGVDLTRMGEDSSVYIVIEKPFDDDDYYVVFIEETKQKLLTDAINRVKFLDSKFKFEKIVIDETGLGAGVVDVLSQDIYRGKLEPLTFTMKSKQDIYSNLKMMMEKKARKQPGGIHIPDNRKLIYQLMDLRYEIASSSNHNLKIHHGDRGKDDYCDSLALAAWGFRIRDTLVYRPVIG